MSMLVKNTVGYFKLLGLNPYCEGAREGWLGGLVIGQVYEKEFGSDGFAYDDRDRKGNWAGYSWEQVDAPVPVEVDIVVDTRVVTPELRGTTATEVITDGLKNDSGKTLMSLLFTGCPEALAGAAGVLTFGAQKYEAHSWKQVESARYLDAFYRHMYKCHIGEETDPDSGLLHIDHALTNLLFIRELMAGGDNPFDASDE